MKIVAATSGFNYFWRRPWRSAYFHLVRVVDDERPVPLCRSRARIWGRLRAQVPHESVQHPACRVWFQRLVETGLLQVEEDQ